MRKLLLITLPLLLIVGCSKKSINYETTLIERDGLYTNWYENGQKRFELTYKDGIHNGLSTYWYENRQKESEVTYKDGKRDGLWTDWDENGKKLKEETYKGGELISKKEWNEDGSVIE